MRETPKPFELYRHFKGNLYQVLTVAKDSETLEEVVVYQALYGNYAVYVRPLAMFLSEVDKAKYPESEAVYRFEKVDGQGGSAKSGYDAKEKMEQSAVCTESEEADIDPVVLEFLDADTYEEKLRILVPLRETITDDMITTMAIATDVEVEEGPTNERYEQLKNCLMTLKKYECDRLR